MKKAVKARKRAPTKVRIGKASKRRARATSKVRIRTKRAPRKAVSRAGVRGVAVKALKRRSKSAATFAARVLSRRAAAKAAKPPAPAAAPRSPVPAAPAPAVRPQKVHPAQRPRSARPAPPVYRPNRALVRVSRVPQFNYMKAPGSESAFNVGDPVEVFCDHEMNGERVRGWVKGVVVQVDNKLVAVQFRSNVFLTDGWMVPDRILWYSLSSDQIRAAGLGKKAPRKAIPEY